MGMLSSIDRVLNVMPSDFLSSKAIYLEVSIEQYNRLKDEVARRIIYAPGGNFEFIKEDVDDFGICSIFGFMGYKIIIVTSAEPREEKMFYMAFKVDEV